MKGITLGASKRAFCAPKILLTFFKNLVGWLTRGCLDFMCIFAVSFEIGRLP